MIRRVKQFFGIEGLKAELIFPEEVPVKSGRIQGVLRLTSMTPQTVTMLRVHLEERYTRGWRKDKRNEDYKLGEITLQQRIEIPANEPFDIAFDLPFHLYQSKADSMADANVLAKGLVQLAKVASNIKSEYSVVAEVKVAGTYLDPFARKGIKLV